MSGCLYAGKAYAEGSLICVNGRELKCSGGSWQETGYACTRPSPEGFGFKLDQPQAPDSQSVAVVSGPIWSSPTPHTSPT